MLSFFSGKEYEVYSSRRCLRYSAVSTPLLSLLLSRHRISLTLFSGLRLVVGRAVAEIARRTNLQSVYGQRGFYCVHSLWSSGSLSGMCPFLEKVPHLQGYNQGDCAYISLINEEWF